MKSKYPEEAERDLFGEVDAADKKIRKKTGLIGGQQLKNNRLISYENAIFLIICFILSSIIFFSIGVEKGKRDVSSTEKESKQDASSAKTEVDIEEQRIENKTGDIYVIQLAAFKTKGSAEDEMNKLRKQGYKADIKKSGYYYQVYIGGFEDKNSAQKITNELKKDFNDCYVKKL